MGIAAWLKKVIIDCLQLVFGDKPGHWAASVVQSLGIVLCLADVLTGISFPLAVSLIGFACVVGGFLAGVNVESDVPYIGPFVLVVLPALLMLFVPIAILCFAADLGSRLTRYFWRGSNAVTGSHA
jgi:hypothetical protein